MNKNIFFISIFLSLFSVSNLHAKTSPSFDDKKDNSFCSNNNIDSELYNAVYKNDIDKVKALIKKGANVNCIDKNDNPIICSVVMHGNKNILKSFISAGTKVNFGNYYSIFNCLDMEKNNSQIIKILVKNGANVNTPNSLFVPPIHDSFYLSTYDVNNFNTYLSVNAKLDYCTLSGQTLAWALVQTKNVEYFKSLKNVGYDFNSRIHCDKDGVKSDSLPIIYAYIDKLLYENIDTDISIYKNIISYLIDNNVDVNLLFNSYNEESLEYSNTTILSHILSTPENKYNKKLNIDNFLWVIKKLIDTGCNVNMQDSKNRRALYYLEQNDFLKSLPQYNYIKNIISDKN